MITSPRILALAAASGLRCGPAWAADSARAPGCALAGAISQAAAGCSYGLAVVVDDLVLIPKSCRHELAGKPVDRQAVEVRALATGARIGQASLPAGPARGTQPPDAGQLLPGDPPLLVLPQGIAALDARKGAADLVFEPQGRLLGAARLGGLLALAEALPPGKDGKAAIEWTVIDLDAGGVVGQALIAGTAVRDLALLRDATGVRAAIGLGQDATAVELQAQLFDAGGKSALKDGQLVPRKVGAAKAAPTALPAGCAVFDPPDRAIVDRPAVRIALGQFSVGPTTLAAPFHSAPHACLAIRKAGKGLRDVAWVRAPDGGLHVVALLCSAAPPPPK